MPELGDLEVYNGISEINNKNYIDALEHFEKGTLFDNENALLFTGIIYFAGFGLKKREPAKAMEFFKRAVSKWNSPVAQYMIGTMYFDGDEGVLQDKIMGFRSISLAAENNWPYAITNMGLMYTSDSYIKSPSLEKALFWYEKLAERDTDLVIPVEEGKRYLFGNEKFEVDLSHVDRKTMKKVQDLLYNYHGAYSPVLSVRETYKDRIPDFDDFQHILIWILLSETNLTGVYSCQLGLASAYITAHKEDPQYASKILYWLALSAKKKGTTYYMALGRAYYDCPYVKRDQKEAIKWFNLACNEDQVQDGEAFYCLGDIYQKGWDGVTQDYKIAYSCFKSAFDLGYCMGATRIASFYCKGFGVEKSEVNTIEWLSKAKAKGCSAAEWLLDLIDKKGYNFTRQYIKRLNKPY